MFIDIIEKVNIVEVLVISFLDELRLGFWFSTIFCDHYREVVTATTGEYFWHLAFLRNICRYMIQTWLLQCVANFLYSGEFVDKLGAGILEEKILYFICHVFVLEIRIIPCFCTQVCIPKSYKATASGNYLHQLLDVLLEVHQLAVDVALPSYSIFPFSIVKVHRCPSSSAKPYFQWYAGDVIKIIVKMFPGVLDIIRDITDYSGLAVDVPGLRKFNFISIYV